MFFHWRLFLRALDLSLVRKPLRLRRWAFVLFFTGLFGVMWIFVVIGRALDHVFFPGFKRQPVREPVFIIAPPRSGTTLTQKLMALDAERFVHVKLYHTIFPCIFYQRIIEAIARLDALCGAPLAKSIGRIERRFFGGWDDMHKMRFNEAEEDDGFFVYSFVTEAIFLLFPYVDDLWEAGFADALPAGDRRRLMAYYKSCLQRHLYARAPDKTLLSKATQSSGSIVALREAFPDARFITIVRHPYRSVASHVSVFYPAWRAHSPEIRKDSPVSKAYARLAVEWYKHLFRMRTELPADRYCCLDYRELVRSPREAIEGIYRRFGFEFRDGFRKRLDEATQKQHGFQSNHEYTLEEFGLSKEWIQAELGELMDFYGLER